MRGMHRSCRWYLVAGRGGSVCRWLRGLKLSVQLGGKITTTANTKAKRRECDKEDVEAVKSILYTSPCLSGVLDTLAALETEQMAGTT